MKHKRLLGYGGLGLTLIALGVAFVKPISTSNLLIRSRASGEIISGNITWNPSSSKIAHQGNRVSYTSNTQTGLGVVLHTYGQYNVSDNYIFSSKKSGTYDYYLKVNAEAGASASIFRFQSITSVTIVTASTSQSGAGFEIYTDALATSSPVYSATVASGEESFAVTTEVAGAHYLTIRPSNTYSVDIKSITVAYSCEIGGGEYDAELVSISISGQTTEFEVGDTFSFGGTVTAHYDDTTSANVTSSATYSGYNMSESGEQTITVSYTENGVTKTTTYVITVTSSAELILTGTYNYVSRSKYSTPDWSLHNMTITFYNDGTCMWRNIRTNNFGNVFDCKVYFTYVATDNGNNITVAMLHTSYDFTKDGEYNNQASSFSGGGYDRPINGGFGGTNVRNDSIVMTSNRSSFTINTYDQSHSYEVYDTFTFSLAS